MRRVSVRASAERAHNAHAHKPEDLVLPIDDARARQALACQHAQHRRHDDLRDREPADRAERHRAPRAAGDLEPREGRAEADEAERDARGADEGRGVHDERERRRAVGRVWDRGAWERDEERFERCDQRDGEAEDDGERGGGEEAADEGAGAVETAGARWGRDERSCVWGFGADLVGAGGLGYAAYLGEGRRRRR